ncbi:MAG: hypothetical protein RIC16_02365 [Rhodospirillales bacterium]
MKPITRTANALAAAAIAIGIMMAAPMTARAVTPKIVDATAEVQSNGLYAFSVTVLHEDAGWTHYADSWDVLTVNGQVLGTRTLFHPHDGENPFTRSLSNVQVPIGARHVVFRAHCTQDGYGETFQLELPPR